MDFLTHSLVGTGAARLICPDRKLLPQLSLAAILGSELMDGDAWLYLLGPNYYGFYHRVVSHSIVGLAPLALLSAAIAWAAGGVKSWRRFGWFVTPNIPHEPGEANSPHPFWSAAACRRFSLRSLLRVPLAHPETDLNRAPASGNEEKREQAPALQIMEPGASSAILPRAPWRLHLTVAAAAAALHFLGDVITGFGNMTPFWPWSRWDASLRAVYSFDVVIFSTTLAWHLLIRNLDWPRRREWPITLGYFAVVAIYVLIRWTCSPPAIW